MKAVITIPLNKEEADKTLKAIKEENRDNERTQTEYKTSKDGLTIEINSKDVTGLKAAINGCLKLYQVNMEVKTCLKCPTKPEIK